MKRILVAVDTTESATLVLSAAVELARSVGAKVRLFHAVPVPALIPQPGVFVSPPVLDVHGFVAAAEVALRGLQEQIPEDLRDGICVDIGHAPDLLCELARKFDPDVVVVGAHEYGMVARTLGTTAARIVNRIDRPVFVVRPLPPTHGMGLEQAVKPLEALRALARLRVLCADGAAGYRCAARTVKAPERLRRALEQEATRREEVEAALRSALVALGQEPSHHGSLEGAAHRGLLEAIAAFAPDAPNAIHTILQECQRGERKTIKAFRRALARPLPEDIRGLLETQLARVLEASAALDRELTALDEPNAIASAAPPHL